MEENTSAVTEFPTDMTSAFAEEVTLHFKIRAFQKFLPIASMMLKTAALAVIIMGVVGNTLSLITLGSKHFKNTPTCFLLITLAVADTLTLLTYMLPQTADMYGLTVMSAHIVPCKMFYFIQTVAGQSSSWTLVMITGERAVSVLLPLRVHILCSYRRVVIAWIILLVVLAGMAAPILVDWDITWSNVLMKPLCQQGSEAVWLYVQWNSTIFKVFTPSVLILIGNVIIIGVLIKGAAIRKKMQNTQKADTRDRSVTIMLTLNAVAYLVLTSPRAIYFYFMVPDDFSDMIRSYEDWIIPIMLVVMDLLNQFNHAINFFLYVMTGGTFRRAFFKAMTPACLVKEKSKDDMSGSGFTSQTRYTSEGSMSTQIK